MALLGGCAIQPAVGPEPVGPGTLQQHAAAVARLGGWNLSGRAAITTAADSGTVAVDWRQRGERYDLELRAPWGAGTVNLSGGPGQVALRTSEGVEDAAEDPAQLLERHTGMQLPVEALRYWLLGIPSPQAPVNAEVDERGLISEMHQNGWRIRYLNYAERDGLAMPTRVFMNGDGLDLRVVVQRWELDP